MKTFSTILHLIIFLLLLSCSTVKELTTYSDLMKASRDGNIQLVTSDTSVYYIDKFTFTDTSIIGIGTKEKQDLTEAFNGELTFQNISYIQTDEFDWIKSLIFTGACSAILIAGIPAIAETAGLIQDVKIVYPSGGSGSCPFIYSWNGERYVLEGEAFGSALGKKLEYETCTMLPALKSVNGKLKIKITNERPETHFFNRINLIAVESDSNSNVYSDNHNKLWAVKKQEKILNAYDRWNKDVTDLLLNDDDEYWQSDLSSANENFDFEDQLVINFLKKEKVDTASLIISSINTEISTVVFKKLQSLMGDDYSDFMKATEYDHDIINILKETLVRSSLKVDIWNGSNWIYLDMIYPEANQVKFIKVFRFPINLSHSDTVKIRLRSLTDVWKIDAVAMVESPSVQLKTKGIKTIFAKQGDENVLERIEKTDDNYQVILPGETMDLEFEFVPNEKNKKISYALLAEGYLYEWIITRTGFSEATISTVYNSTTKLEVVKTLLKNINLFLPMIYEEWELVRDEKVFSSDITR